MLGTLALLLILGSGCWISQRALGFRGRFDGVVVGLGLAVALYLLALNLALKAGLALPQGALVASVGGALLAGLTLFRQTPEPPRPGAPMSRPEQGLLLTAMGFVWLFTNMMQVITVDDDYWIHTPVQARMLRGVIPPTNPYFPDLVLGGHYGRDTLVASVATLTGRDTFASQVLLTSFCHSLSLATLYLAIRRSGTATSALAGTGMGWLGVNVAHRVGLLACFENNGAPTYLLLALLGLLFIELWKQPGPRLALTCGAVLGVYAQVYETHFGLVVLTVLSLLPWQSPKARQSSLLAVLLAGALALLLGSALSRLTLPPPEDEVIANQSQTVQVRFPKTPLFALRIETGEIDPISAGYRTGLGRPIFALIDHTPERSDPRYVRLWSWNVLRMHWLGVWLAPLSGWLLWRSRHQAGLFLWVFGVWAYLVPGVVDFGPIHEFEWFRWEFAAGFALATALGIALGSLVKGWRHGLALALFLLLNSQAGLAYLGRLLPHLTNPRIEEVLGISFDTRGWLLRHGKQLQIEDSDLRALDWIAANPQEGKGCFFISTGPPQSGSILFESTAMALADTQALGHKLPDKEEPIGVPPFRFDPSFLSLLEHPSAEKATALGIDWLLLRSDDVELEKRLASTLNLVYYDPLAADGKRRLLFRTSPARLSRPEAPGHEAPRYWTLEPGEPPAGATEMGLHFLHRDGRQLGPAGRLPALPRVTAAVPLDCHQVQVRFLDASGRLREQRVLPVEVGDR